MDFCIISAKTKENTFYIFREDGVEIEVAIKNNYMVPSHNMTEAERIHFRKHYMQCGDKRLK